MRLLSFERRWLRTLCETMLPAAPGVPGAADVPLEAFFDEFFGNAPRLSAFGVRAVTWLLTLAPLLWRGRTFGALAPADRIRFLDALDQSPVYLAREAPGLVKLVACLAWAAMPEVQRALGVTHPDPVPDWAVTR